MNKKIVLNVGCGKSPLKEQSDFLTTEDWREVRVDAWKENETADVISSITELNGIDDKSADCIWASHVVEHVYWHELPDVFNSFMRVLKDDGFAIVRVPDLKFVAQKIISDGLLDSIYQIPMGPVCAIDMLYGHRGLTQEWGPGMAHRTGFTEQSMGQILGSLDIKAFIKVGHFEIIALLYKDKPPTEFMDFGRF